jgi:putative phage-type endonuclease
VNLKRGSNCWRAWHRGGLGSSDAAAAVGVSPWLTPRRLWEIKTGRAPEPPPTFAMRRGLRLKPAARRLYEERMGRRAGPCCVVHDRHDWLRASLDGLDVEGGLVVMLKAPRATDHRMALEGQIPAHFRPQVQHQLAATGLSLLHFASYSENLAFAMHDRLAVVEVRPEPGYQGKLLYAEWCFWGCVMLDYWPARGPLVEESRSCTGCA